ncbi:MAG: helix-turn-helix domain-containing protein [Candidatus Neomarinimicrobiota bacterium]
MAQFYKELKELRESREISLEEISERTKINVIYLKAIEIGDFNEIETPYLRLFLRAYAEEIGGESERALEQLDSFLGTTRTTVISSKKVEEEFESDNNSDTFYKIIMPNKKLRQDYIIGGILSIVLLFSIAIFQKIFNKDSSAIISKEGPLLIKSVQPISNTDLQKDYMLNQSIYELLPVNPPFFIKIKTLEQTAFYFKSDTLQPEEKLLKENQEIDLNPFVNNSELIFSKTNGLSIFINAYKIKQISNYQFPVRLLIKPNPPSIGIQRFKPLF